MLLEARICIQEASGVASVREGLEKEYGHRGVEDLREAFGYSIIQEQEKINNKIQIKTAQKK